MIIRDPNIMLGKPVIKGTRITVELILEKLISKHSVDSILNAHPQLTQRDIIEAIQFAITLCKGQ